MFLDGQRPKVFKLFKNLQIYSKYISGIEIKFKNMPINRVVGKFDIPIMCVLYTPRGAVFSEFTVENLNFGFILDVIS